MPTRKPRLRRATARLAVTVDFPTPPLPDVGYVARHGRFVRSLRFLGSGFLNNNGDGSFQGGKILFQQRLNLPFDLQGEGIAHFGEIQGDGYLVAGSRNLFDESALDKTVLGLRMEDTVE